MRALMAASAGTRESGARAVEGNRMAAEVGRKVPSTA